MKLLPTLAFLSTLLIMNCERGFTELSNCNTCQFENYTSNINGVQAKVILIWQGMDEQGQPVNGKYALTTDTVALNTETWRVISDRILVPCDSLPKMYRVPNLKVKVSGTKSGCCNAVSLPDIRGRFGCHFKVTFIEKL